MTEKHTDVSAVIRAVMKIQGINEINEKIVSKIEEDFKILTENEKTALINSLDEETISKLKDAVNKIMG